LTLSFEGSEEAPVLAFFFFPLAAPIYSERAPKVSGFHRPSTGGRSFLHELDERALSSLFEEGLGGVFFWVGVLGLVGVFLLFLFRRRPSLLRRAPFLFFFFPTTALFLLD